MSGQRITKRVVDGLEVRAREYTSWDSKMPCFGVRIRQSGAKSYIVVYRAGSGRGAPFRRYTIATVGKITIENARQQARSILGAVARGQDPAGERASERETPTIAELTNRFLAEHVDPKRKPGTAIFYRDILTRIVVPDGKKPNESGEGAMSCHAARAGRLILPSLQAATSGPSPRKYPS